MARTAEQQAADQYPESTLGPSSTMVIELSNIVFVFECGRPGLQSSTLPLSVRPSRDWRPWIELSKSMNLLLPDPFSTEYVKQNANQLSEIIEQSRLGYPSLEEQKRQRHSVNEEIVKRKDLEKLHKLQVKDVIIDIIVNLHSISKRN